jgi:glycosyltransferase involved in cell wall biosynthesis
MQMSSNVKPPMRIAHIIPAITVGGLWRHLEAISHLDENRFRSLVISIFDRDMPELVTHLGLPVVQLKLDPGSYKNIDLIQAEIKCALLDFSPAVLHSYHLYSDIYSLPLVQLTGCRGVRAIHGITQVEFADPLNRSAVKTDWTAEDLTRMKEMSRFCSLTLAVSGDLKRKLVGHGFEGKRIRVVHPGVDLDRFRWRESPRREREIIGFLGRLEPVKNPKLFLEIASQCKERGFAGQFWLIGDGRLRNSIRDEIERRGLSEHVLMKPETSNVESLLKELDILLVTSLSEGLPLSILEAMATGVPVIASRVGGVSEVVDDGRDGFLCDIDRPAEFVDRIMELLSDPNLKSSLALRALTIVARKFSLVNHLSNMGRVYYELT